MFSLFSGAYNTYMAPSQVNLLVVGASGVGKTSLLERIKVTQFDHSSSRHPAAATEGKELPVNILKGEVAKESSGSDTVTIASSLEEPPGTASKAKKGSPTAGNRSSWMCPAPARYHNAIDDDDEADELIERPQQSKIQHRHSSMDSVELSTPGTPRAGHSEAPGLFSDESPKEGEFDLRKGAHMLPMDRVRPTIGMNLAKQLPICGAKCNVWDVGGKLQNLWERYYEDCDAVMFVWKLDSVLDESYLTKMKDDNDDSEIPPVLYAHQLRLLEQVRQAIPDDVPFLILVHAWKTDRNIDWLTDQQFATAPFLLEHYHNPFQALFLANAATGRGVRSALQWLVSNAKQQQRVREKQSSSQTNSRK